MHQSELPPHTSPSRLRLRRRLPPAAQSFGLVLGLAVLACRPQSSGSRDGEGGGEPGDPTATTLAQSASVAEIVDIKGRGGVQSSDLPEGAFLGIGGKLAEGQRVTLPRGTRAELALATGQKVRINEGATIRLPTSDAPDTLEVESGEVVVLCNNVSGMKVRAAEDVVEVVRGEMHITHDGDERHFSMVHGKAVVKTGDEEFDLGPGASLDTPIEKLPDLPPGPKVSLDPLEDAAWADSFEVAKNLAADLPAGIGSLTARRAGSKQDRQALRLVDQKVKVTITGRVARTEIEQAFHNDASTTMEGIYKFPLPGDASISSLRLLVANRWIDGEMLEKRRARQIFREIVDATVPRDPALLQWDQGNVFKLNIFPIPANGERRIRIAYTQMLPAVGDTLRYRYPMAGSGATGNEIENFSFAMTLDGNSFDRAQLENVVTPMMDLARTERPDGHVELSVTEKDFLPMHEMGADIPLPSERQRSESAMYVDRDGQGYFMASLRPQIPIEGGSSRSVDYAIVLDRSHGTTPELWTTARGLTQSMLAALGEEDHYTILACDTDCDTVFDSRGVDAFDPNQIPAVEAFLDAQVLAGASDIGRMLESAKLSLDAGRPTADKVVIYMGDGAPSSGALTPDELRALVSRGGPLEGIRVQAVALGSRADMLVLDTLVRETGGDLMQADARDDLERLARELRLRGHVPVARDLELELPAGVSEVYPKTLSAMRPGETLTIVGKVSDRRGVSGQVRLKGQGPSGPIDESFPMQLATSGEFSHAHLPRTWAQEHLQWLTATKGFAAHDEIVALSRDYNVLSRFTALLVLENDAMFREFGVARKARNKDTWNGELSAADAIAAQKADLAGATATATPKAGVDKLREERQEAKSEAQAEAPAEGAAQRPDATKDNRDARAAEKSQGTEELPDPFPDSFDPPAFEPEPEEARDAPDADEEAEAEAEAEAFDDFEDDQPRNAAPAGPPPAPRKKAKAKPQRPSPSTGSRSKGGDGGGEGDLEDIFGSGRGGGGNGPGSVGGLGTAGGKSKKSGTGSGLVGKGGGWHRRMPQLAIRAQGSPSSKVLARIDALAAEVDRDPTRRSAHGKLVRAAVAAGHPNVTEFAAAWAEADPDHAPALTAHADVLAAQGNPLALRAHASAVEVKPFSDKLHRRMANALAAKGDHTRACSHRRALVSIDPAKAEHHADLARCLHRDGRTQRGLSVLVEAQSRVKGNARALASAGKDLGGTPTPAKAGLHSFPDLKATLSWSDAVDLDIVVVDRQGRRLSATRPERIRVREERNRETLTFGQINRPITLEVTMHESENAPRGPVRANLVVQTPTGRKTFNLVFEGPGSQRIAQLRWN